MLPATVLLDVGGVLTVDPWQTLLLTPERGIAARLGLEREEVTQVGSNLWRAYARRPSSESAYWAAMSSALKVPIGLSLVAETERDLLVTLPGARQAIQFMKAWGRPWGLITNNTTFWYAKQLNLLDLTPSDVQWQFTSFSYGREKTEPDGLLVEAARHVSPCSTLLVDDRSDNLESALTLGYQVLHYPSSGLRLADALRDALGPPHATE